MANVTVVRHTGPLLLVAGLSSGLWACGSEDASAPPTSPGGVGLGGSASGASGASNSGGAPASGGAPTGSSGAPTSNGGSEGQPDLGGVSGSTGSAGAAEPSAPDGGTGMQPEVVDERPFFSFFVTSQVGLFGLPAGEFAPAPSATDGYGGNLGGLAGADEICTLLARSSSPTDRKTWRAFLSTSAFDGSEAVDAIDRVGPGPWYNYNGLLLAATPEGLLPASNNGRPDGDAQLVNMFTDENGEDIQPNEDVDNHDTLTGSGQDGRLYDDGDDGRVATCENWTSSTLRGTADMGGGNMGGGNMGGGGQVPVGHSWPRSNNNGRNWIQDHTVNGCEPGANVGGGGGAAQGDFRVGAGGGFGAIYCFALGAVAPE